MYIETVYDCNYINGKYLIILLQDKAIVTNLCLRFEMAE